MKTEGEKREARERRDGKREKERKGGVKAGEANREA